MIGSAAVDVAVGLVFTYFIFAMLCSGIAEFISRLLNLRGKLLKDEITRLLGGKATDFWNDPLISQLSTPKVTPRRLTTTPEGEKPAATMLGGEKPAATPPRGGKQPNKVNAPSYISAPTFAVAVMSFLPQSQPGGQVTAEEISIPNAPDLERLLKRLLDGARGDITKMSADLEQWFNDWMDRVSGFYKRYMKRILLLIALALTVAFNVNTLFVAQTLWREPTVRAAIAQVATGASQSPQPALGDLFKTVRQEENIGLPIGWTAAKSPAGQDATGWLWTIAGWLVTAAALTFGAPFWFDMLGRLNSLRSTGPPPGSPTAGAASK